MYNYQDRLDVNQLYTNNIQAMAEHYGIEAANQVIIQVNLASCSKCWFQLNHLGPNSLSFLIMVIQVPSDNYEFGP